MKYILFNPKSKNGNNVEIIKDLENIIGEEGVTMILEHLSSTKEKDYGNKDN